MDASQGGAQKDKRIGPVKMLCDCGETLNLPANFWEGGAMDFWESHGHFPKVLIFECRCGAQRKTGLDAQPDPLDAGENDREWYSQHRNGCGG
jgi:hypothetical protein